MDDRVRMIYDISSDDPDKRIGSRLGLLREFPAQGDNDVKKELCHGLVEDVMENRKVALDYLGGMSDLQEKAYAVMAFDSGFRVDKTRVPPSVGEQRSYRERFVRGIEYMADELQQVLSEQVKLRVSEIIAREGRAGPAMIAVEKALNVGWNIQVPDSICSSYSWPRITLADSLLGTVAASRLQKVKRRALEYLADIPDNGDRGKYLEKVMCNGKLSDGILRYAVDLYVDKVKSAGRMDSSSVAHDAILARDVAKIGGDVIDIAATVAVEHAFDLYVKRLPDKERVKRIYSFTDDIFGGMLKRRGQGYPRGLRKKVMDYFVGHIEEVDEVSDMELRGNVLLSVASTRDEVSLRAIDMFASREKEGVENIAKVYSNSRAQHYLSNVARERVCGWAVKYVRDFADLGDVELARSTLRDLSMDEELDAFCAFDLNGVAKQELGKLPKEETGDEKLAVVFGVKL